MKEQMHKGLPWFGIPKLYPYLKVYGSLLFWMVFMGLVASGADVAVPLFQQYAIDHFIADKTMQGIWGFVGLYVLVIGFQIVSNYISLTSTRTASATSTRVSCRTPTASRARWLGASWRASGTLRI